MTQDTEEMFKRGLRRELDRELRDHCIIWHTDDIGDGDISYGDAPPISVELTDRAKSLLMCYAVALEVSARESEE